MQPDRIVADDVTVSFVPDHVDPDCVIDFDYLRPFGVDGGDIYQVLARLHDGPDLVWTPHHGGHWVATRGEDIRWIQESWDIFSATEKSVPRGRMPHLPPITVDPPEHTRYRAVLNPYFTRRRVEGGYKEKAHATIAALIEHLRPRGRCEFVAEVAFIAPIAIFFDFVDLPFENREQFLVWGRDFMASPSPRVRMEAYGAITGYLGKLLDARLDQGGADIFTGISEWRRNPRFRTREELIGMAQLVFLGGQDTVAAQLCFAMWRLLERPDLQRRLQDDPAIIPAAVEEFLRRHALSSTARLILKDITHKGATLKADDMILVLGPMSGIDPRMCEDPFTIDFDRAPAPHNSLGNGPHKCVGQHLARLEMRVFLEEWARSMPLVSFDPDKPPPSSHAGGVIGVDYLHLVWTG